MYPLRSIILGTLVFVHAVAATSQFDRRGILLARNGANSTNVILITSTSTPPLVVASTKASPSSSSSPVILKAPSTQISSSSPSTLPAIACTTTVTSILGQQLVSQTGSCTCTTVTVICTVPVSSDASPTISTTIPGRNSASSSLTTEGGSPSVQSCAEVMPNPSTSTSTSTISTNPVAVSTSSLASLPAAKSQLTPITSSQFTPSDSYVSVGAGKPSMGVPTTPLPVSTSTALNCQTAPVQFSAGFKSNQITSTTPLGVPTTFSVQNQATSSAPSVSTAPGAVVGGNTGQSPIPAGISTGVQLIPSGSSTVSQPPAPASSVASQSPPQPSSAAVQLPPLASPVVPQSSSLAAAIPIPSTSSSNGGNIATAIASIIGAQKQTTISTSSSSSTPPANPIPASSNLFSSNYVTTQASQSVLVAPTANNYPASASALQPSTSSNSNPDTEQSQSDLLPSSSPANKNQGSSQVIVSSIATAVSAQYPTTQASQCQMLPVSSPPKQTLVSACQLPGSSIQVPGPSPPASSAIVPVPSKVASSVAVSAGASITTQALPPSSPPAILLGSQTISLNSASDIVVGSRTLSAGSAITVSGQQISLGSSGAIIINGASQTSGIPAPASKSSVVIVASGTTLTSNPSSSFKIGTQTLFPGSAITAGSGVISIPSVTPAPATKTSINTSPILILGSETYTENASSDFIIASQTLAPGSAITVSGQVISLSPTGNAVIVNAVPTLVTSTTGLAPESAVTSLVIAGQTLTAGGRVTLGGDVLSLAPSGTDIVVIGTLTVSGGESTATATAGAEKKNSGSRAGVGSWAVQVQFCCVLTLGFWLH